MEWSDRGVIVGLRRHGEASAILDVLTAEHGRHLGLVRGATGSRLRPVLQLGNSVSVHWRARLEEHLGHYAVEGLTLRAASYLGVPHALYALTHVAALVRLLPERDPHPALHAAVEALMEALAEPGEAAAAVALFELQVLAELGFGLDLASCAATGTRGDLAYVSPRSGRAVSRAAGLPWHNKMLALPAFLRPELLGAETRPVSREDIADAFAVTGFFLLRRVLEPRGAALPLERERFLAAVLAGPRE